MKIKDILAIATLGIIGGNVTEKKRKQKKREDVDCCPKCGSHRI